MSTPAANSPVAPALNIANALTVARLAAVPVFVLLMLTSAPGQTRLACALFLLAAATDVLDGHLARRYRLCTPLGALLDPIADKALTGTAFTLLAAAGVLPWWAALVIIGREALVTGLRMVLLRTRNVVVSANGAGKLKTATQTLCLSAYLVALPEQADPALSALLWITVTITLYSGWTYLRAAAAPAPASC